MGVLLSVPIYTTYSMHKATGLTGLDLWEALNTTTDSWYEGASECMKELEAERTALKDGIDDPAPPYYKGD